MNKQKLFINLFFFTVFYLGLISNLIAQDGSLDTNFGSAGIVYTSIDSFDTHSYDIAIQADNKIVVAGAKNLSGVSDFLVMRYKEDGTIDSSFGLNGMTVIDLGGFDVANCLVIQSDGKIIVAGTSNSTIALIRLNSDGTFDNSFDSNGIILTEESGSIQDLVLQADGKIIATGSTRTTNIDFFVYRYNADGSPDSTFGLDGKVTTDIIWWEDYATGVAIQPDGKIVVCGYARTGVFTDPVLIRYNTDGTPDTSFGTNGITIYDNPSDFDFISDLAIQSDGKIILGGFHGNTNNSNFALYRFENNGTIDESFGNNGYVIDTVSSTQFGRSLVIQPDGKIILTGFSTDPNTDQRNIYSARYNATGNLDKSFGINGYVLSDLGGVSDVHSSILQANQKLLVAGEYHNGSNYESVILRYNNTQVTGVESEDVFPNKYILHQNYPNPFNPTTTIKYSIPAVTVEDKNFRSVQLKVYDVLGREVATLVNEKKSPGTYKVTFDASILSSGIYFYKFQTDNFVETKKMILLR